MMLMTEWISKGMYWSPRPKSFLVSAIQSEAEALQCYILLDHSADQVDRVSFLIILISFDYGITLGARSIRPSRLEEERWLVSIMSTVGRS